MRDVQASPACRLKKDQHVIDHDERQDSPRCGDQDLLDRAGILANEQVDILNITNGERFTTYAINAPRGSKTFGLNGAAARRVQLGDKIIIIAYCQMEAEKARNYAPNVVLLDDNNEVIT